MKNAFIDWVVPVLVERGFRGVFPNYRRNTGKQIDIISLQFSLFDQALCISVAKCPIDGISYCNGEKIPGDLVTANHCPKRFMLGVKNGGSAHWFKYSPSRYELRDRDNYSFLTIYEDSMLKYKRIADDIVELIELQADAWLRDSTEWWHQEAPVYNKLFFDIQKSMFEQLYG
ncbi:MAG: DUF4304 domain-containing protein [Carboxydocellales bacterium]